MLRYNLRNVITEPTRVCNTRNSLLDPILLTDSCLCNEASVIKTNLGYSDHYACLAYVDIPISLSTTYKREVWLYKHADFDEFNRLIEAFDWHTYLLFQDSNIDIACQKFTEKFLSFARLCIPTKFVTIRPNDKPWMTSELRKEIHLRNKLHKKARHSQSPNDILIFKNQRNKVNNMKQYARQNFFENVNGIIDNFMTNDPKSYWKLIGKLTKTSGKTGRIPPLIDSNSSEVIVDDKCKASLLNNYFCSISTINDNDKNVPVFEKRTNATFSDLEVSSDEICDVLKNLKLGKASGKDTISHQMLRGTKFTVCKPLKILFNFSLLTQMFPKQWKESIVLPLYKKGDRHDVTNYRPI
ncbi:uncharacterized protein LOC128556837 [Mercenaria mercenaria]|uniref:uncharacterized protein LOC128556837 n=1 Tax=Mercenaria mercenaria TaxID=6596 RepID=UPI00234EF78A|nr:uncharacterized protein LOC128556837 [Mercenaria mercenaria]